VCIPCLMEGSGGAAPDLAGDGLHDVEVDALEVVRADQGEQVGPQDLSEGTSPGSPTGSGPSSCPAPRLGLMGHSPPPGGIRRWDGNNDTSSTGEGIARGQWPSKGVEWLSGRACNLPLAPTHLPPPPGGGGDAHLEDHDEMDAVGARVVEAVQHPHHALAVRAVPPVLAQPLRRVLLRRPCGGGGGAVM